MSDYKKPCLDSSVFLGGLNKEICGGIKRGVVFRYLWEAAESGNFKIYISALTIAEVYRKHSRSCGERSVHNYNSFLKCIDEPFVEVIEIDREMALDAHELCRKFSSNKLRPNDALHVVSALRAGCDVLLAWDDPLVSIEHEKLRIEEPRIVDRTLFTETEKANQQEIDTYDRWVARRRARQQKVEPEPAELSGGSDGPPESPAAPKGQAEAESDGGKEEAPS